MANIVVVYLCWLFGGIFGLHHFYLGRDKHAFVWMMSFGGFGLGMFRDLWRLPEYLCEFNRDLGFLNEFAARRARYKDGPPFNVTRFAGQLMIGGLLAYLFRLCIPEFALKEMGIGNILSIILPVAGSSVGIHLVANIGHQKCDMKWCILGSFLGVPWMLQDPQSLSMAPVFGAVLASKKAQWDTSKLPPKGVCKCIKRAFALSMCGMIYMSMWTSVIYFNTSVPTKDGEYVPMHEAVQNFFKSPAWKEMKKTMIDVYNLCNEKGWGHCYQLFLENMDPTGEIHAYKILEFEESNPSPEEIQSHCRKMARKYHPDKFKGEEEKKEAQEKFIEIQKACDILNELRKRRQEKNMKSESTTKRENTSFKDKDFDSKSTNENFKQNRDSRKQKDDSFKQSNEKQKPKDESIRQKTKQNENIKLTKKQSEHLKEKLKEKSDNIKKQEKHSNARREDL